MNGETVAGVIGIALTIFGLVMGALTTIGLIKIAIDWIW
jgi:hypothetical protein